MLHFPHDNRGLRLRNTHLRAHVDTRTHAHVLMHTHRQAAFCTRRLPSCRASAALPGWGLARVTSAARGLESCPDHGAGWGREQASLLRAGHLAQQQRVPEALRILGCGSRAAPRQPTGPEAQGLLTMASPCPFPRGSAPSSCSAGWALLPLGPSPLTVTSPPGHLSLWSPLP